MNAQVPLSTVNELNSISVECYRSNDVQENHHKKFAA